MPTLPTQTTTATTTTNLPTIQRFYADDFAGAPKWFQQFINTLNLFTQQMYNIVNAGISISQNTAEEIYSFSITAGATYANNTFNFTPRKFAGRPNGVIIGQVTPNTSTVTAVGAACTLDWTYNAGQVQIIAIYGLTNTTSYTITVRIF